MKKEVSEILKNISDEISITESMKQVVEDSYEAVGKYLGNNLQKDIYIFAQGSMALGTVIKPISDADEYDIDLVCLIKDGMNMSAADIKNSIGNSLKQSQRYHKQLESEGKRCWTLDYANFHMDILPAVPKNQGFDKECHSNIRLTHKISDCSYEDRYSDPLEYQRWFKRSALKGSQGVAVSESRQAEIDGIPDDNVQSNLQSIIKLLKRHRDIFFEENNTEYKPISIIVTTLAAQGYKRCETLYDELMTVLQFIGTRTIEKPYIVKNPIDSRENFADKWNEDECYKKVFYEWADSLISDFSQIESSIKGLDEVSTKLATMFGEAPVKRAIASFAENKRKLREKGELGVCSLSTGLSSGAIVKGNVKNHTFYGGKDE